jgi:DNA-binding IscR family transcriptional regulator
MKKLPLTTKEKAVISALSNEHLTSLEILSKAQKVPHILKLYTILDELRNKGVVNSYIKKGVKFHYAA